MEEVSGRPASFEEFVRVREGALRRYGFVLTGSMHDGADLVQDALIRLSDAWPRVRAKDDPEGFVRVTMVRLHISKWRRLRRERLVSHVPEAAYSDADIERLSGDAGLWRLLATLSPRQRAVLVLRYYEDLADEDIAVRIGVSRNTVRSLAARGLARLRETTAVPGNAVAVPEVGGL
ncbi:DNA-directed RNA polymerase sigma-70 factor [Acrocarpospora phusangensis]|uniref:DNA-directed RNA polymerase sigma-70 factor n=1 Tax=Acrocarpospora phusangensis TaxID=1070424 RepID=A0A919ULY9_9ACTN|nr:SigE family RNA polymerase sigma factor [Acrocarpospora phusangensis]GIH22728.1 DNA-directed RNA polymerase sigma-70 factor [Acrocarpospora phusangensis]